MGRVWIMHDDKWTKGKLTGVAKGGKSIVMTDNGIKITGKVFPVKNGDRRKGNVGCMKSEVLPHRNGRFRRPVSVMPVRYVPGQTSVHGDYRAMLRARVKFEGKFRRLYDNAVMGFNDNTYCFLRFLNHGDPSGPMGGNACARPAQGDGNAVAIPTGPFQSLDEIVPCTLPKDVPSDDGLHTMHTAKDVVDAGVEAIVDLFMRNPHKDTLYYSAEDESDRIGLAIFAGAVGDDVIDYITSELKRVPMYVQSRRTWKRA